MQSHQLNFQLVDFVLSDGLLSNALGSDFAKE